MESFYKISQNGNVVEYILQNMVKRLNQSEGDGVLESKVFCLLQLQSFVAQSIRLRKLGNLIVEGLSFLSKFQALCDFSLTFGVRNSREKFLLVLSIGIYLSLYFFDLRLEGSILSIDGIHFFLFRCFFASTTP